MRGRLGILAVAAALALPATGGRAADEGGPEPLAVRAGRALLLDGAVVEDAVLVLRDGKVASVAAGGAAPEGVRVLRGAVAVPGFADLWTRGRAADAAEDPRPFGAALRAADGFDPLDPAARAAAREGVTARLLLPSDVNPLGGRVAGLRAVGAYGRSALAAADAGGTISLSENAARRERYPGSFTGLLRALDSAFDLALGVARPLAGGDPALGMGEDDRAALAALAGGEGGSAFLFARTRPEVRAALRLAGERRLRPVLVDPRCGAEDLLAGARAAGVDPAGLAVILVLEEDDPLLHLRAAGALRRAGVRVGFGSGTAARGPDAIRRAAALAVRHGMDPGDARAALGGAGFPGLGRGPKGIEAGATADLVLLDGDPVEPASRVLAVIAGGEVVDPAGRRR